MCYFVSDNLINPGNVYAAPFCLGRISRVCVAGGLCGGVIVMH